MSASTPGPWIARRDSKGNFVIFAGGPGRLELVATVPFELEVSANLKRTRADAHLIAASSQIAETLADFVAWAEEHRAQCKRARAAGDRRSRRQPRQGAAQGIGTMTPAAELFTRAGTALYGPQFTTPLALAFGIGTTCRKFANGTSRVPPGVWRELAGLIQGREAELPALKVAVVEAAGST